ncbi:hypothetical protein J2Z50_004535 [Ensifer mexicanus]|nr:hypothetical protein [Sinorhizobium mexicanum]
MIVLCLFRRLQFFLVGFGSAANLKLVALPKYLAIESIRQLRSGGL